ncbi:MAG: hypothetical protein HOV81_06510 [Kofleriaceae bacterium]|nr:hypothetical protein [Kofleriaceae bacterium]
MTVKCERRLPALVPQLHAGTFVWFGEMHGTEESPRFVGDAVCEAARVARVQLGLEIWRSEQASIDDYLRTGDRKKLLAGPFWATNDGRSSTGMVELLDRVRALRKKGAKIEVVAYDVPEAKDRDFEMAKAVIQARDALAIYVGLSGNIHSRRTKGTPWNPDLVPMVAHIAEAGPRVVTYDVSASGGEMWACMATPDHEPECGVHPNSDTAKGARPWTLGPAKDASHDGVYYVGVTKAAPPAKQ